MGRLALFDAFMDAGVVGGGRNRLAHVDHQTATDYRCSDASIAALCAAADRQSTDAAAVVEAAEGRHCASLEGKALRV
jgi:hypothetical protein